MCIPTCIHPSIHPSIYTYIRVSYFRFCAKRRGIVPNVRSSTRFPHFFVWKRYRILSRESGIILSFVERRSFPVRIQCFTMCFVPVGIMKRVDAASSRRVVLSSRCSKERLKRRFRKVGSGSEVRDTGWWCLVSVNGNFSSERNFLIANEIRAVFRLVLYPSLSNRIVDNDPVRRSRKEKTDDTRSLPSRTCT